VSANENEGERSIMSTVGAGPGLVYQNAACTILDTREMEWEEWGPGGSSAKVLSRFDNGEPSVFLWRSTAGRATPAPYRHYHKTVRETHFWLDGEFPLFEYESPDEARGRQFTMRAGWYLDRLPGIEGIHGIYEGEETKVESAVGSTVLIWRDGVGNFITEENAHDESPEVRFPENPTGANAQTPVTPPEPGPGQVYRNKAVTILDTREMPWESEGGFRWIKVLSRFPTGQPSVFLCWTPPGIGTFDVPDRRPSRHYHKSVREYHLWLDGEFPLFEYESADQKHGHLVWLRQGHYLERLPGPEGIHGVYEGEETRVASRVGSLFIAWRDGPGNFLHEPEAHEESPHVPFPD
jgi:hypothetical protein